MSQIGFHRHSLSLKLGAIIISFVVVLFVVSLGLLYNRSRQLVKQEAMERAGKVLDKTALRVTGYLSDIEAVTENVKWIVNQNQTPDSLLAYTHRIVTTATQNTASERATASSPNARVIMTTIRKCGTRLPRTRESPAG